MSAIFTIEHGVRTRHPCTLHQNLSTETFEHIYFNIQFYLVNNTGLYHLIKVNSINHVEIKY